MIGFFKRHKSLSSIVVAILLTMIALSTTLAIVYIPVPSFTLLGPATEGWYLIGGTSGSGYYAIGFAIPLSEVSANVSAIEPLPILNPDMSGGSAPTNPISPLVQAWADMWNVPVNIGWVVGSMFLAICTFIVIAYKFQHIGFAMCGASLVIGFFSYPSMHILPIGAFIIAIIGLIAGVVVEARA